MPVRILPGAMALLVAGCSLGDAALPSRGDDIAQPPPNHRKLITGNLIGILGEANRGRALQISGLRRVDSFKGLAWLVCVRSEADARLLDYAVFIQDEKIVDSRLAVRSDHCEAQPFEPFGVFTDSQRAIR